MTEVRLPHGVQKPLCGPLNSPSHQNHDQEHEQEHELYMQHPARNILGQKIYVVHGGLADCTLLLLQEDALTCPRWQICCNHLTLSLTLYMQMHYDMATDFKK